MRPDAFRLLAASVAADVFGGMGSWNDLSPPDADGYRRVSADLYRELGADYELSIDLKDASVGTLVVDLARAEGDPRRLWVCSPSRRVLRELRAGGDDVRLVHSTGRRYIRDSMERHAADLAASGIDAINLHHSEWTAGLVSLFHRFGLKAFAWDTQEVRNIRAVLRMQIDAVYCDRTDRMVATVGEWSAG